MIKELANRLGTPAPLTNIDGIKADQWQRVSPLSVIYFILKFITQTVRNGIQAFAVAPAAILATSGDNRWYILAIAAVIALASLIIGSILSYVNFRFRIEHDRFLIRSGVFKRKRLTLSFDRIQNIAFREPIYFRPFGLIILALESAGSSSEEVSLAGLPRPIGDAIRKHVLAYKEDKPVAGTVPQDTASSETISNAPEEELLKQPITELARYGISNNNIWVFAGIAAGFLSQVNVLWEKRYVSNIFDTVDANVGSGIAAAIILIITGTLAIMLLLILASVMGAVIVNYNYRLTYTNGRFHRTRGLLERQETSLPLKKIQNIQIAQPLIAKLLNRSYIIVGQIGFKHKNDNHRSKKFIIPSVKDVFSKDFTERLYGNASLLSADLNGISVHYAVRVFLFSVMPIAIFVSILWFITLGWLGVLPLAAAGLTVPFIIMHWRKYGYTSDGKIGLVQTGFFGTTRTVFPFHKIQTVKLVRSPGQRRYGFATLKIMLAGKTVTIPYISNHDAQALRDQILYVLETSNEPWM